MSIKLYENKLHPLENTKNSFAFHSLALSLHTDFIHIYLTDMNIFTFKKLFSLFLTAISLLLFSCSNNYNGPTFTITGTVKNAEDRMLYLSNIGTDNIIRLDSVKLNSNGNFKFIQPQPECYDFYILSMRGQKSIIVPIDSTETVTLECDAKSFATTYNVSGSEEASRIKEIEELQQALEKQVNSMINSNSPAIIKTRNDIYALIGEFKKNIIAQYIASNPSKASAYYALSLTMNGEPIFNPMKNRTDSKCFAAVATSLQNMYPHTQRAKHMYELAEKAMKATRPAKQREIEIGETEIKTTGLFDIKLPNAKGDSIALSSLAGKVVLLDFTLYEDAHISSRNIKLRDLYERYSGKGLEIYQISFDNREHFWQQSASNLPWICVRDAQGASSPNAMLYNVQTLPTFYLINRENEIVLRDNQIEDLEKEIKKLIAQ